MRQCYSPILSGSKRLPYVSRLFCYVELIYRRAGTLKARYKGTLCPFRSISLSIRGLLSSSRERSKVRRHARCASCNRFGRWNAVSCPRAFKKWTKRSRSLEPFLLPIILVTFCKAFLQRTSREREPAFSGLSTEDRRCLPRSSIASYFG